MAEKNLVGVHIDIYGQEGNYTFRGESARNSANIFTKFTGRHELRREALLEHFKQHLRITGHRLDSYTFHDGEQPN